MTPTGITEIVLYLVILLLLTKPLGTYMAAVYEGRRTWLDPALRPLERLIYRVCGIDATQEHDWKVYGVAMLLFNGVGLLLLYAILRLQQFLPFNPAGQGALDPALAWNTAISFTTNTNWQNYTGEATMSYLTQMAGLATHNWMSAATGIVAAVALVRGLARRSAVGVGSFWVDVVRCVLYLLLPILFIFTFFLIWQGVPQNFSAYTLVHTLEGGTQTIAQGPIATQEAIKELGTNGGGFMNANSAHPYENPTPLSNFGEMLSIFLLGSGLVYMFGKWVGNTKQGWALWAAMFVLFSAGYFTAVGFEQNGNHLIASHAHVQTVATSSQPGGNMEGKEVRFGIVDSAMWATITTDASCGAINAWHDSFMPLAGAVPLVNMATGEVIFGGVGAGLYGMLMYAILAVFIAGLMVGRMPEYLGKKVESFEIKMASLALLISPANILFFSALAIIGTWGTAAIFNPGPHGLSEVLYAFTSQNANNGSAFAGLGTATPTLQPSFNFYNVAGGIAMLIGRFLFLTPLIAIGGSMARKKTVPVSLGTFPTDGPTFSILLIAVIVIVAVLTYFPAYSLGPIIEQLLLNAGKTF